MTDITASDNSVTAAPAVDSAPVTADTAQVVDTTPVVEVKTGVKDFEAAFSFVEQGVEMLGEAAKDELKALAQKYL